MARDAAGRQGFAKQKPERREARQGISDSNCSENTQTMADQALIRFIAAELAEPTFPEAHAFAAEIGARPGVAAVLFYGSCLQRGTAEGMLDFYALTDGAVAYGQKGLIDWLGRRLPPNVYPETFSGLKAKVAVVSMDEFHRRMEARRLDTTFWARFCQRAALAWVRDDVARTEAAKAVASAAETAARWAAHLAPEESGADAWRALFARTYKIEIRVEKPGRAADIVGADAARFEELWRLTAPARDAAPDMGSWALRWWVGKVLHVSRLLKAALTFEGGPRYLLWKIRRHRRR